MSTLKSSDKLLVIEVKHSPKTVLGHVTNHDSTNGFIYYELETEKGKGRCADDGIVVPYGTFFSKGTKIEVTLKENTVTKIIAK